MKKVSAILVGGTFLVGTAVVGTGIASVFAADKPTSPTPSASTAPPATQSGTQAANDLDTAADKNLDNGAVLDADVQENNAGVQEKDVANEAATLDSRPGAGVQEKDAAGGAAGDTKGTSQTGVDEGNPKP